MNGPPVLETGCAMLTLAGQQESGDRCVIQPFPAGVLVAAIDGLGHGHEAAEAARVVAETLERNASESVISLFRRCHESSTGGRGVVMSLASFNCQDSSMTWAGVGNVEGLLLRADPNASPAIEALLMRAGGVGFNFPQLRATAMPVTAGDTLVFATDGIQSQFAVGLSLTEKPQRLADRILEKYKKGTDDALVLVARYLGAS